MSCQRREKYVSVVDDTDAQRADLLGRLVHVHMNASACRLSAATSPLQPPPTTTIGCAVLRSTSVKLGHALFTNVPVRSTTRCVADCV